MQKGQSHVKDSGDFTNKIKELQHIPDGSILVTSDAVALYPSIPHEAVLTALKVPLDKEKINLQLPKTILIWLVFYCKIIILNSMA